MQSEINGRYRIVIYERNCQFIVTTRDDHLVVPHGVNTKTICTFEEEEMTMSPSDPMETVMQLVSDTKKMDRKRKMISSSFTSGWTSLEDAVGQHVIVHTTGSDATVEGFLKKYDGHGLDLVVSEKNQGTPTWIHMVKSAITKVTVPCMSPFSMINFGASMNKAVKTSGPRQRVATFNLYRGLTWKPVYMAMCDGKAITSLILRAAIDNSSHQTFTPTDISLVCGDIDGPKKDRQHNKSMGLECRSIAMSNEEPQPESRQVGESKHFMIKPSTPNSTLEIAPAESMLDVWLDHLGTDVKCPKPMQDKYYFHTLGSQSTTWGIRIYEAPLHFPKGELSMYSDEGLEMIAMCSVPETIQGQTVDIRCGTPASMFVESRFDYVDDRKDADEDDDMQYELLTKDAVKKKKGSKDDTKKRTKFYTATQTYTATVTNKCQEAAKIIFHCPDVSGSDVTYDPPETRMTPTGTREWIIDCKPCEKKEAFVLMVRYKLFPMN